MTVGEAARFLLANFGSAHGTDVHSSVVCSALERAAETDSSYDVVQATKAMILLLETEKLTPGHTEGALRIEREQRILE